MLVPMQIDNVKAYAALRQKLIAQKAELDQKLREINRALEEPPAPAASPATRPARPNSRSKRRPSPQRRPRLSVKRPRALATRPVPSPRNTSLLAAVPDQSPQESRDGEPGTETEVGRCRFCGSRAIPGSDVCLSCDDAR